MLRLLPMGLLILSLPDLSRSSVRESKGPARASASESRGGAGVASYALSKLKEGSWD